jgi:pimeloyl-ACP methyl ester carboxylesterase
VIEVAGSGIHWVAWGKLGDPGIVLVHGARAHVGWWRGVVGESIVAGRRVVALDLSGHGDSDHRTSYSAELWGDEVAAVVAEIAGGQATLVGHSMGGWASVVCAARRPEGIGAIILLDCFIRRPRPGAEWEPRGMSERPLRSYRSRQEAVEAFRLVPAQPVHPELLRAIAEASVRPNGGGWQWKFDPAIAQGFSDGLIRDHLLRVRCPIHLVYGTEDQLVSAATADEISSMTGLPVPATALPGAHHHALLDHPDEVAAALLGTGMLGTPQGR